MEAIAPVAAIAEVVLVAGRPVSAVAEAVALIAAIVEVVAAGRPVSAVAEAVGCRIWASSAGSGRWPPDLGLPVFVAARASLPVAVGLPRRPSDLGVSPSSAASRGSPPAVAGVLPSAVIAACLGRLSPPPPVGSASVVRRRLLRCLPPGRLVLTSCRRRGGLLHRLGSGVVFFIGSPSLQDLISAVAGWSSCTDGCWLIPSLVFSSAIPASP
ncbi:hypothetical protein GUJ93_ZPchr0008g13317 [Zizania palustris]|uniref:Uncharacterized protein n=1 Tax=Zizania palustris TaxID=103762 RepID=A0A8J5RLM2_ZIZPA|nr:hypothetical protein GUJ93_ZPchr0008g13317 [Zizania palustris]